MGNTETGSRKTQRSDTGTGINKMSGRRGSHVLFNSMDLRVTAPGELDMDAGLLFVHHERAGPEREDISPDIAAGQEFVDPGDGVYRLFCKFHDPGRFFLLLLVKNAGRFQP